MEQRGEYLYYCKPPAGLFGELAFTSRVVSAIPFPKQLAIMSPRGQVADTL